MRWLDAPEEIATYHWEPLRIAFCLLTVAFEKCERPGRDDRWFQEDEFDAYRREHADFVNRLDDLRDSFLHQRYENLPTQGEFVNEFRRGQQGDTSRSTVRSLEPWFAFLDGGRGSRVLAPGRRRSLRR